MTRDRLKPGGVMCQWVQLYEMELGTYQMILRTFRSVYPHVEIFRTVNSDSIILGSTKPLNFDLARITARMGRPEVAADLEGIGITSPLHLAAHHIVSDEDVHRIVGEGGINRDDYPILEYEAPRQLFIRGRVHFPEDLLRVESPHYLLKKYMELLDPSPAQILEIVQHIRKDLDTSIRITLLEEVLGLDPSNVEALLELVELLEIDGRSGRDLTLIQRACRLAPESVRAHKLLFNMAYSLERKRLSLRRPREYGTTLAALESLIRLEPDDPDHRLTQAAIRFEKKEYDLALQLAESIRRDFRKEDGSWPPMVEAATRILKAACYFETGRLGEATPLLELPENQESGLSAFYARLLALVRADLQEVQSSSSQEGDL